MQIESGVHKRQSGYLSSTGLVILAFAAAFFPRVLMILKIPSMVNFLHFLLVPFAFGVAIFKSRSRNARQLAICKRLLWALGLLLTLEFVSALVNDAGAINVVLHFLLFTEPFLLLVAIICIPMSDQTLGNFRKYILGFGFSNLLFAMVQKFLLKWDTCGCSPGGWSEGDAIKGVFISQGSGHVVGASVSIALAVHYVIAAKNHSLWLRLVVLLLGFTHIIVADAKQVILVVGTAFALLVLINMKDIRKSLALAVVLVAAVYGFTWAVGRFEFLSAYLTWARPELYGPDGDVTQFKLLGIGTIASHMKSPAQWWFGLGPGHTVDRLGGWMLKDYADLLAPLGSTRTPIADEVWTAMGASWLANASSMFAPLFGWLALWGDLGFVGLAAYLYLCLLAWRVCPDDLCKWQMMTVFVNGWIFTQMQEPGYMLFLASLIGLRWQEAQQIKTKRLRREAMEQIGPMSGYGRDDAMPS